MVLTGRLVALAALGLVLAVGSGPGLAGDAGVLAVLVGADLVLAGRIADLQLDRQPSAAVRLGQDGESRLAITNRGRRRLYGRLRDAWVPSAGVRPREQDLLIPAGERRLLRT